MKSLGLVEVQSVAAGIDCLDIMCKAADVNFVTWERKLGGRLVTIIVEGQVSAVKAAVEAANNAIIKPAASAVIASPHSETERMVLLSASRLTKRKEQKKAEKSEQYLEEV